MTETQRRIRAYQKVLPELRERVIAVALLLAMSASMLTSASFAWLTISRRPEVSGVSTTVAANGNLEIALATSTTEPGASKVGDSSAAQDVALANVTWGNLVNLSDPAYGLENLSLRPAQLNKASLLDSPLYGAEYTADGRIQRLTSNFSYTQWVPPVGTTPGYFGLSNSLGVRAISSTKVEAIGVWESINAMKEAAVDANTMAGNQYITLTQNDKYMESLAYIMGVFMTDRLNASQGDANLTNPTINKEHLGNLVSMYEAFSEVFDKEAEALAALLNLQLFMKHGGKTEDYTPYTKETLVASTTTANVLTQQGLTITDFTIFKNHYNLIKSDLEVLRQINAAGTVKWQGDANVAGGRSLKQVITSLVNLNTCTLDGTPIQNIGASNASGYLNKSCQAVITNGVLYEFERRTGAEMKVGEKYNNGKGLKLKATVKRGISIDGTIYAIITTSAPSPSLFSADVNAALNMTGVEFQGTTTAEDTYGMAIDLWVRTNAPASYLTLEGNVLTKTDNVQSVGTDANGNEVNLYTISRQEEVTTEETDPDTGEVTTKTETVIYSVDVYPVVTTDDSGKETTTWYNYTSHTALTEEQLGGSEPLPKYEEVVTVLGFEGENRVWDDDMISVDATTQGSGSCYVYYADTPEDQAKSLKLLEAFNVAFVDEDGALMAMAEMDTAMFYAENGRVTVPLVLSPSDSINLGEDYEGKTNYGITMLEKNKATRITAIIFLDGTKLTNKEVLAAADIQGQLNIQFGTSQTMEPIENEDLASKVLTVSASVDKTKFDYDTHEGDMVSTVTVNVNGDTPSRVTGFFLRAINSTQGSREETMEFTKNESGAWVAQHTFTSPGNYVLRSVELDGISRDLQQPQSVEVTGFAVKSLSVESADDNRNVKILSAENTSTKWVKLQFATNDASRLPKEVQGRFLSDAGTVNINFKYDTTTGIWEGDATFLTSGDYTMQYLVLDGEYMELDENLWYTADVTLGMRVAVYTNSPTSFKYLPSEMTDDMKVLSIQARITDNADEPMPGLSGVELTYGMKGSLQTMNTSLTWDGTYYVGGLTTIGAGNWQFSEMKVGTNILTSATTSPVFTIIPPEPPEYYTFSPNTYQYVPNGGAKMTVQLANAGTATVKAVLTNTTSGTTYSGDRSVVGTVSRSFENDEGVTITEFSFTLPADTVLGKTNVQDGNWRMDQILVWDYFDANGNYVSSIPDESTGAVDDPMVIDMSGKNNVTKAVQTVNVSIPLIGEGDAAKAQGQVFGKDANGNVTAQFMDSHTVSGLHVAISDFAGDSLEKVSEVKLKFVYGLNSETYGHYTSDALTNSIADFAVDLADDGSGTHYIQTADQTLTYAGTYTASELSFKVDTTTYKYTGTADNAANNTKKMPENAPVFEVWSKSPTVTVTGISPAEGTSHRIYTGTISGDGSVSASNLITGDFSRSTDYSATVYIYGGDNNAYNVYTPTVKLKLSGMPSNGFTADMKFAHKSNSNYDAIYSFTSNNQEVTKSIGGSANGSWIVVELAKPKIYPAGKQTVDEITVVYNNITFAVDLSHEVTINQPQYPPYVDFADIYSTDSTFTGTTPSRVYSEDGETITLPSAPTIWVYSEGRPVNELVYGDYVEVETVGRYYVWAFRNPPHYHLNRYERTGTVLSDVYEVTKKVQWKIGNKTYNPGERVEITGMVTATPVISVVEELFIEQKETTYIEESYMYIEVSAANGYTRLSSKPTVNERFDITERIE